MMQVKSIHCNLKVPMDWQPRLTNLLHLFICLGTGILLGGVGTFHFNTKAPIVSNYYSRSCPPSTIVVKQHLLPQLHHQMGDEELLWRASVIHRRRGNPVPHVPKVAFLFLSRGPLPLAQLWEHFFAKYDDFYSIYVHADPDYTPNITSSSVFYGRNIPSQHARWGEMSICDAERRLFANALLEPANDRFVLLSETCIPLYNFSYVYSSFVENLYSYISAVDDPSLYGRGRYHPGMAPEVTLAQWRKGSQWFEVGRDLAVEIVADTKYYPKFRRFCVPHCYVDEHYIQTMLSIEWGDRLLNRTMTHTDWMRGGAHPTLFEKEHITKAFLSEIRKYYFFSRKYAPSALEPLLKLAPQVMAISVQRG